MSRLVSIVVPCHGERQYTELCVGSIRAHTHGDWELILVDNGSVDDTLAWASSQAAADPRIRCLELGRNYGFARGVNAGLAEARGTDLVILNNDAVLTKDWLDGLLRALDEDPRRGIVGPMCNYINGPQRVEGVPYDDDMDDMATFAAEWSRAHTGEREDLPMIVGFCMLVPRAVLDRIGGFDPVFGNGNFEDDDFSLRARLAGWSLTVARDVFLHHFGSRTFKALGRSHASASEYYRQAMAEGFSKFRAKWRLPAPPPTGAVYDAIRALDGWSFDTALHKITLEVPISA